MIWSRKNSFTLFDEIGRIYVADSFVERKLLVKLKIILTALCVANLLTACTDSSAPKGKDIVTTSETLSPLDRLFPGQRLPERWVSANDKAYVIVDLQQNSDAETGTMTVTLDSASNKDCEALTETVPAFVILCLRAKVNKAPVTLSAKANFRRSNITLNGIQTPMGAYAAVEGAGLEAPLDMVFMPKDGGDYRLGTRASDTAQPHYTDIFTMAQRQNSIEKLRAAEAYIADARK